MEVGAGDRQPEDAAGLSGGCPSLPPPPNSQPLLVGRLFFSTGIFRLKEIPRRTLMPRCPAQRPERYAGYIPCLTRLSRDTEASSVMRHHLTAYYGPYTHPRCSPL